MQCLRPFKTKEGFTVPCGKCIECRISYSREWSIRLMHELIYSESGSFVTLTYDDGHLPKGGTLVKRDPQLFIKRIRKNLPDRKIKYFLSGEYGDKNGRPHYHAIMFNVAKDDEDIIKKCWKAGIVDVGYVTYDSCRYTADYVLKKYNGKKAKEVFGNKLVPFRMGSQGIGKRWLEANEEQVLQKLYITMRGVKHALPRYYVKLLGEKIDPDRLEEMRQKRSDDANDWYEEHGVEMIDRGMYQAERRYQKAEEHKSRMQRSKKGHL